MRVQEVSCGQLSVRSCRPHPHIRLPNTRCFVNARQPNDYVGPRAGKIINLKFFPFLDRTLQITLWVTIAIGARPNNGHHITSLVIIAIHTRGAVEPHEVIVGRACLELQYHSNVGDVEVVGNADRGEALTPIGWYVIIDIGGVKSVFAVPVFGSIVAHFASVIVVK